MLFRWLLTSLMLRHLAEQSIHQTHSQSIVVSLQSTTKSIGNHRTVSLVMDPVITFLRANRSFSLSVLLTSFSEIVSLQSTAGSVLYDDIVLKVTEASACAMEEMDVSAHAALLFESCVLPKINTKGEMTLQLKTELSGGDSSTFVKALLQIIHSKVGSEEIALKFRAEADAYLQDQASASNLEVSSDTTEVAAEPFKANWRMKREPSGSNFSGESSSRSSSLSTLAKWPTQQELNEALSDEFSMVLPASRPGPQLAEPQEPSSSVDVEKNEPMVRLLAFARRGGMDILFPQSLHDKVRSTNSFFCNAIVSSCYFCFIDRCWHASMS